MAYRRRTRYSDQQLGQIWDRWQQGETLNAIGRALGKPSSSIHFQLARTGGIRPRPRTRSRLALSLSERESISRGLAMRRSLRQIARGLNRSPSTVSREVSRNGGMEQYRAAPADQAAWDRAQRPKACKLVQYPALARIVAGKLEHHWSPDQIAHWLKQMHPQDESKRVSHETLYKSLFIQARGALKKELQAYLQTQRSIRRSKQHSIKQEGLGQITGAVSIRERPASVEDRAVPGHWEGDLIFGSHNSQIATLVERHSRYVMLVKVNGKDSETVINALIKHAHKLPTELYQSLTWDRGSEMADHQRFTLATDIQVYFCDPQSPWQRGSNENTNRLLRTYFPKKTDLSEHSQATLNKVARELNERPRKTLGYKTPAECFNECVASIN